MAICRGRESSSGAQDTAIAEASKEDSSTARDTATWATKDC